MVNKVEISGTVNYVQNYDKKAGGHMTVFSIDHVVPTKSGKEYSTKLLCKDFNSATYTVGQEIVVKGRLTSEMYNDKFTLYVLVE